MLIKEKCNLIYTAISVTRIFENLAFFSSIPRPLKTKSSIKSNLRKQFSCISKQTNKQTNQQTTSQFSFRDALNIIITDIYAHARAEHFWTQLFRIPR